MSVSLYKDFEEMSPRKLLVLFVAALELILTGSAGAQVRWTRDNPSPASNTFDAVAFANESFVAVGEYGAIATSSDGSTWTSRESGTDADLRSIVFDGSQFIVAAKDGSLLTSTDGSDWHSRPSVAAFEPAALGYGAGTYVLLGYQSSSFLTSPDLITWSWHELPAACLFGQGTGIVFAANTFVAAGDCLMSSTDGLSWSAHTPSGVWAVAYGNGQFVASHGYDGKFEVSSDGSTWTENTTTDSGYVTGIAFGNGRYLGVGGAAVRVSDDGVAWDWEPITPSLNGNSQFESSYGGLKSTAFGAGVFVAVGDAGMILYSSDAVDWYAATFDLPNVLRGVAFGAGLYVAAGDSGTIQTSANAQDWTPVVSSTSADLYGLVYGGDQYVIVGKHGSILTSADATTWVMQSAGSEATLHAVAFGDSTYVAVGSNGTVVTSPDAITWTDRNSGTAWTLRAIAYGSGRFVATGDSGVIVSSVDGITWVTVDSGGLRNAQFAIAYGNNEFVVIGRPYPKYSFDGLIWHTAPAQLVDWQPISAFTFGNGMFMTPYAGFAAASDSGLSGGQGAYTSTQLTIRSMTYGSAGFVGVGNSGIRTLSPDGLKWTSIHPGAADGNSRFYGVAAGDNQAMAVGIDFASLVTDSVADLAFASINGESWEPVPVDRQTALSGVAYHAGTFVASSVAGLALVRSGGQWSSYDVGIGKYLAGIDYVNDQFITRGNGLQIASSPDGISWTPHAIPSSYEFDGVAFGKGTYVVVGTGIFVSTDLQNWTSFNTSGGYDYVGVAFGRSLFVAAGSAGLAVSQDGFQWTTVCDSWAPFTKLLFAGDKFVAIGGHAYISFNGKEWYRAPTHTSDVDDLAYTNRQYIAVGSSGGLLRSSDDLIFASGDEGVVCPQQ